jgi:ATP-dependent 26S proteasome regulatory subunit
MGSDLEPKPQTSTIVRAGNTFVTVAERAEFMPMLEPLFETHTISLAQISYDENSVMHNALLVCRTESKDVPFQLQGEVLFTLPSEEKGPTWEEPFFVNFIGRIDNDFEQHQTRFHRAPSSMDIEVSATLIATLDIQQHGDDFAVKVTTSNTLSGLHLDQTETIHDRYFALLNVTLLWAHVQDTIMDMYANHEHDTTRNIQLQTPSPNIKLPKIEVIDEDEKEFTFDDIIGYKDVKRELLNLALAFDNPELAKSIGLESNEAILLYGVGGTGKTSLLKALATEIGASLVELNVAEIIDKWLGSSAINLDDYFMDIKDREDKVVLLIDEFDSIGVSAKNASSGERVDTVNRLKDHIIDIITHHHNILLVGATNNFERVDKALIRPGRLRPIEIKAPDFTTRAGIWSHTLGKAFLLAITNSSEGSQLPILDIDLDNDINIIELAQKSEGMVGAHPKEILNAIRRTRVNEFVKTKKMSPITQRELLEYISRIGKED